jgi:hypothetical protein
LDKRLTAILLDSGRRGENRLAHIFCSDTHGAIVSHRAGGVKAGKTGNSEEAGGAARCSPDASRCSRPLCYRYSCP